MSRSEREKGARGERECVELLTAHGLDAERTFYQPGSKKADVDSLAGRFEVKLRARFVAYDWLHDDVRGIYVRADRKPALIILRAEDAAKLLEMERRQRTRFPHDAVLNTLSERLDQYKCAKCGADYMPSIQGWFCPDATQCIHPTKP